MPNATERDNGDRPSAALAGGGWSRLVSTSIVAGVTGFVAGAVVWHFIGFWGFVGSIVLRGPEPPAGQVIAAERDMMPRAAFRAVGMYRERADPARCSSIGLDRGTGSLTVGHCDPTSSFAIRASGRKDRLAPASRSGWIVEVNADREP